MAIEMYFAIIEVTLTNETTNDRQLVFSINFLSECSPSSYFFIREKI